MTSSTLLADPPSNETIDVFYIKKASKSEVEYIIQHNTNPTKAPGYDLLTGTVIKELSQKGIRALTQIYNAILRLEYFPWTLENRTNNYDSETRKKPD